MFKGGFFTKLPVWSLQSLFKSFTLWQRLNSNSNPSLSLFVKVGFFSMLFNPSLAKHALSAVEGGGEGEIFLAERAGYRNIKHLLSVIS
jgi:hypothetical protein